MNNLDNFCNNYPWIMFSDHQLLPVCIKIISLF